MQLIEWNHHINYKGVVYQPGHTVTVTDAEADRLVTASYADYTDTPNPPPVESTAFRWRGSWSAMIDYTQGDLVNYQSGSWYAEADPPSGAEPHSGSAYWAPLAEAVASDASIAALLNNESSATFAAVAERFQVAHYPIYKYGGVGDGVVDDTSAVLAAEAAARAAGGGVVTMDHPFILAPIYRITGPVVFGKGVGCQGSGSNSQFSSNCTFKFDSATARIQMGQWGGQERCGAFRDFGIDGNNTGDSDGALFLECVTASVQDVNISDAAGAGVYLNAAQNTNFTNVNVFHSAVGITLDNGAGGCGFFRCELSSNQIGVLFTDGPGGNAYPFGPADNKFWSCIIENYLDATCSVKAEAGANNHFFGCGISNNGFTLSDNALVLVTNTIYPTISTHVHFHACNFNGGGAPDNNRADIVRIAGPNRVHVTGPTYVQQTTRCWVQDGGTGILVLDGSFYYGGNVPATVRQQAINGGSLISWNTDREMGYSFSLTAASTVALATKILGDAGGRFYVLANGNIGWQSGADFTTVAGLSWDATNLNLSLTGGLRIGGRFARSFSTPSNAIFPTAGAALTLDSRANSRYRIILNGTGSVSSMTVTNPSDGAVLTIMVAATAGQTFTWATNMRHNELYSQTALPTSPASGKWVTVHFMYDGVTGLWLEQSRALNAAS